MEHNKGIPNCHVFPLKLNSLMQAHTPYPNHIYATPNSPTPTLTPALFKHHLRFPEPLQFKSMAEFTEDFQSFKPSHPFLEIDSSMDYINSLMGFPNDCLFPQKPEFPTPFDENLSSLFTPECPDSTPFSQSMVSVGDEDKEKKKRKTLTVSESSSGNSSTLVSETGGGDDKIKRKNNFGRGKRGRCNEKQEDKPKEVIHVRARRGQATDSHSLAERVRREKINERMRHLQDLVPGCYKTMGMAVMLDEIINYVQSLQNQVEFLSMKLSAASSFHDFNLDTGTSETQQATNPYVAQEMDRLLREGYGGFTNFHSTWPL